MNFAAQAREARRRFETPEGQPTSAPGLVRRGIVFLLRLRLRCLEHCIVVGRFDRRLSREIDRTRVALEALE